MKAISPIRQIVISAIALVATLGCTGTEKSTINDSTLVVRAMEKSGEVCEQSGAGSGQVFAQKGGDPGGSPGRLRTLSSSTTCLNYDVALDGSCADCDSIVIEGNGVQGSTDVDANGGFSVLFNVGSLDNLGLTITPMKDGELGEPYTVQTISLVTIDIAATQ